MSNARLCVRLKGTGVAVYWGGGVGVAVGDGAGVGDVEELHADPSAAIRTETKRMPDPLLSLMIFAIVIPPALGDLEAWS
jgi:hypothetical protein